ncbi:MAG: hypothetical protein WC852_01725 [Candidatus Nanoarchaeia archaeon]|jgi:hypothetical protein
MHPVENPSGAMENGNWRRFIKLMGILKISTVSIRISKYLKRKNIIQNMKSTDFLWKLHNRLLITLAVYLAVCGGIGFLS